MDELRQRKGKKKEESVVESASHNLIKDLDQTWKEAEAKGIKKHEYTSLILNAMKNHSSRKRKGVCKSCLRIFDCIWTIVLILTAFVLIVAYVPQVNNYLSGRLHIYAYDVNRVVRLSFVAIHPYLLKLGLDFTKMCLVQNPFVNDSMKCPCISHPEPIEFTISPDIGTLPDEVLKNRLNMYVIRNAVPIRTMFGRDTLVQYLKEFGNLPEICFQIHHLGEEGPSRPQQLTEDKYWNELMQSNKTWDYTWQECADSEMGYTPLRTLLPSFDFLFEGFTVSEYPNVLYSLATQWGRSISYHTFEFEGRRFFLVLQGRVRVRADVTVQCLEYCPPVYRGVLLSAGDAILYDERYWSYSVQTWSNTSFTMATPITIETSPNV